jgi:hypothetical protein
MACPRSPASRYLGHSWRLGSYRVRSRTISLRRGTESAIARPQHHAVLFLPGEVPRVGARSLFRWDSHPKPVVTIVLDRTAVLVRRRAL